MREHQVVLSQPTCFFGETRKFLIKHLKLAIFKRAENRIFPNNFFWVRIWALNGRVENVKIYFMSYGAEVISLCFVSWQELCFDQTFNDLGGPILFQKKGRIPRLENHMGVLLFRMRNRMY